MTNNYINERIRNPHFKILLNGKEVRKYAFYRQAMQFYKKHNGGLFGDKCEIVDMETSEILN